MKSLTILLPTKAEAGNLPWLFDRLREQLEPEVDELEILVVDAPTGDGTEEICKKANVRYIGEPELGFAGALKRGFKEARHDFIATMDADGSHDPLYIRWMLREIDNCDLVIGSRYVPRGGQETTWFRYITSRILNKWVGTVCSMPVLDLSGGFKLYRKAIFNEFELESNGFEIQCEIAIKTYGHGFKIKEIPFCYHPRKEGRSKAAVIKYGLAFLFGSLKLRRYRNSIAFCDYDERAFHSRIPMQMYWQQKRFHASTNMLKPSGRTLDIGCGSGRVVMAWPEVVGIDMNLPTLRYLSHDKRPVARADAAAIPFRAESFDTIFCCEVIEHLPEDSSVLSEITRLLKPGGKALISTPDYGGIAWPTIEWLYKRLVPAAYGHTHITHFDRKKLEAKLAEQGLTVLKTDRVFGSVLLYLVEKPST